MLADDRPGTIPGLLRARAEGQEDRLLVRVGDGERSYGEMVAVADQVAAGFAKAGVEPGDRVSLLLPNRIELVESFFALAQLGVVQVPLNVFLKGEFLRYQLADSGAATIVVDGPGLDAVLPLAEELPGLRRIVVVGEAAAGSVVPSGVSLLRYEELEGASRAAGADLGPSSVASIMYTSGTTGLPKGCVLRQGYYEHVGRAFSDFFGVVGDDHIYCMLPLYHLGAFCTSMMPALFAGASAEFIPAFSATAFMADARAADATVVVGVGPLAEAILKSTPPAPADRTHRIRLSSFAPLTPASQVAWEERFGCTVHAEGYGQTECVPISYTPLGGQRGRASVGRPAPWLDVAILDDDDRAVGPDVVGEIAMRPKEPHVMFDGYWGMPEATLRTFRSLWHHTGDYGTMDADGLLHFVDRKKDALRRRGENVSSLQVEAAILGFEKVAEVAVHAVASELGEDEIKACLVLHPDTTTDPKELFAFFKQKLPYFAVPRYVEVMDQLPRNQVSRVLKHQLRDRGITPETWDLEALGLVVARDERRG